MSKDYLRRVLLRQIDERGLEDILSLIQDIADDYADDLAGVSLETAAKWRVVADRLTELIAAIDID